MKRNIQTLEEKKHLLELYLKGKLAPDQLEEFLNFLQAEEGQKLVKQSMDQTGFSDANSDDFMDELKSQQLYKQINSRMKKSSGNFKLIFRIAASFLLLIAIGWGIYSPISLFDRPFNEIVELSGDQQQNVVLPDGTHVRLNHGSRLVYSSNMAEEERRMIILTGEAFFDVAPNPEKPFVIEAGNAEVKVLGTVFNVKTMLERNKVIVAVQEGKVSLKGQKKLSGVILTENEVGVLDAKENANKVGQSAKNYFSWFQHFLEFENAPLSQVISQLENIFDTTIEIQNPDLNNKHFTAYMKGASVDEVMNQLALSLEIKLKKEDGKYFLK